MRDILYKGKALHDGQWIAGSLAVMTGALNHGRAYILPSAEGIAFEIYGDHPSYHIDGFVEIDQETIGQFTGILDMHGKLIFEGDRCRLERPCVIEYGEITFVNGCFWFDTKGVAGMMRLCDAIPNGFELEVVGNVYDKEER